MSSKAPDASSDQPAFRYASRFEPLREINRGGIGGIKAAFDPTIGRYVAIKTLLPACCEEASICEEFAEEAQITGQLDHPNIVPVYDLLDGDNGPSIVMKLIRGKSLGELIAEAQGKNNRPERLQRFVQIVLKLCDALDFAHSRGVIHCDLKPDNVMVGDYGQVYLMDWGIAWVRSRHTQEADEDVAPSTPLSDRVTQEWLHAMDAERDMLVRLTPPLSARTGSAGASGTYEYMAPEQCWGRSPLIDPRTDIFGLGGILHEILMGKPPYNSRYERMLKLNQALSLPTESPLWPRLPPELSRITLKALALRPDDRYPNVEALRRDLEQFLNGGGWFETRVFRAGEQIVVEGEPGDAAYIIEKGQCEVFKSVQGERVFIRRLGTGDVFGETAVLTGAPRSASVTAVEDTTVKVITGESLNSELDTNPWLATFVRSLATLFREADARPSIVPSTPGDV